MNEQEKTPSEQESKDEQDDLELQDETAEDVQGGRKIRWTPDKNPDSIRHI